MEYKEINYDITILALETLREQVQSNLQASIATCYSSKQTFEADRCYKRLIDITCQIGNLKALQNIQKRCFDTPKSED